MIIEFSIFNCQIFIPLIFPIFIQIEDKIRPIYIKDENNLFKIFRYYISYLFSIIFVLIIYFRTNSKPKTKKNKKLIKNETDNNNSFWINPLDIQQKKMKREKKLQSVFFIILLVIVSLISNLFNQFFHDKDITIAKQSLGVFFEIIFSILLSILLLKTKLYKHHYFSLGIISFTLLILIISFTICHEDDKIEKAIWYYFLYAFFYFLYDALGKKYMNLYFDSPYIMMVKIGLISSILLFIYDALAYNYYRDKSGIIIGFKHNINSTNYIIFIIDLILEFIWNLGIWLTLYYFSPSHFIISESISEYIYYTLNSTNCKDHKKEKNYSIFNFILYSVCYLVNIISSLIFTEIIIINIKGLGYYTKKKINERERLDTLFTFKLARQTTNTLNSSKNSNIESFIKDENEFPQSSIISEEKDINNLEE
jgi:hypothetical protein